MAPPAQPAGLARAQETIPQLRLLLGARVPAGDVRKLIERVQPEQLQELDAGAVQHRTELRMARLLDEPALEQRGGGGVCAHAADAGDLRTADGLQVGDDGEGLGLRGRERRGARLGQQTPRRVKRIAQP